MDLSGLSRAADSVAQSDAPAAPLACEAVATSGDYRHLSTIAGVAIDLRYASVNNFVGRNLYAPLDCAWLHRDAAQALAASAAWLAAQGRGERLLVLDAMRPQRVQEALWAALQGTSLLGYLAPPERGSIHSFGMAVDATVIDAAGNELDMGSGFDELNEKSHPALETKLHAEGALSEAHLEHRQRLRDAMRHGGFQGISHEWWHFDCGDREHVRRHYPRIL